MEYAAQNAHTWCWGLGLDVGGGLASGSCTGAGGFLGFLLALGKMRRWLLSILPLHGSGAVVFLPLPRGQANPDKRSGGNLFLRSHCSTHTCGRMSGDGNHSI